VKKKKKKGHLLRTKSTALKDVGWRTKHNIIVKKKKKKQRQINGPSVICASYYSTDQWIPYNHKIPGHTSFTLFITSAKDKLHHEESNFKNYPTFDFSSFFNI